MALIGRIPVSFEAVFPAGAYAVAVEPVTKVDRVNRTVMGQARDWQSGRPLWAVTVHDPDPKARRHETQVFIDAIEEPVLPPPVDGLPLHPVVFDGLTAAPYVNQHGRRPRVGLRIHAATMRAPDGDPPDPD